MSKSVGIGTVAVCLCGVVAIGCSGGGSSKSYGSATAATTSAGTPFGGTTGGGTTGGGTGGGTTIGPGSGLHPAGAWYSGDMHGHSAPYSQDAARQGGDSPGVAFFLAEVQGLDFYALTDHRTMDQINDPSYTSQTVTILSGEEWGGSVHIGMAGITQVIPEIDTSLGASTINAQVQQAYDNAHLQGGLVTTNHPCQDSKMHVYISHDFDAVEVWNAYWNFPTGYKDSNQSDIDDKLNSLGLTQIGEDANPEIKAAVQVRGGGASTQALAFWTANLNMGRHKAIVGGGDRHSITFPGIPTTYVWAEDNTREKIVAGIRAGRTWVGSSEGPTVEYDADADGDGVFERIIGDSVPLNQTVTYRVRVKNAMDGRVDVVKNGQTIYQYAVLTNDETFTWTDSSTSQSWTRVDVFEKANFNLQGGQGFQLLALTGSLFGQGGMQGLATVALPYGFQVSVGTRYPTIRLPHEIDKILNYDRNNWGYARGAITSPIWAE